MKLASISFRQRFIISNLVLVLVVLPALGISLFSAFKQQAELSEMQTLEAYSYNLLAQSDVSKGKLLHPQTLDSPNFALPDSGLYAIIRDEKSTLWHSSSFVKPTKPIAWPMSEVGQNTFTHIMLNDTEHFNWQLKVAYEQAGKLYPFTFHIIKSKQQYYEQLDMFTNTLWTWLAIIGLVFAAIQIAWMLWFQKPLHDLSQEIEDVEKGNITRISKHYPKEIRTLNNSLNRLIETEAQQRQRYKNTLADLAHSLKTPLAVVLSEPDTPETLRPELQKLDAIISHQLKRAQGGQSSWQTGCKLAPVIENTINGLSKIYRDKHIQFDQEIDPAATFYGAQADAYEIVGNLLDNACKACNNQVKITVNQLNGLSITISDNGNGLSAQQSQNILQRGYRADTYEQGQGIGLAVVTDLVKSYGGEFTIVPKSKLGGAQFSIVFKRA